MDDTLNIDTDVTTGFEHISAPVSRVAAQVQPLAPAEPALTPAMMIDRALQSGAGIDVLERLMGLQERWDREQARKAFNAAMARARGELPEIVKGRSVDFTNQKGQRTHYMHEDLAGIQKQIDPILARHGLSYFYETEQIEGGIIRVTCVVTHEGGHETRTPLQGSRDESGSKNNYQAVGSAVTYLQRYTLKAALGLASAHDDDAGGAGGEPERPKISAEQVQTIRDRLAAVGADEARFCAFIDVPSLDEIFADKFDAALAVVEQKKAKASGQKEVA